MRKIDGRKAKIIEPEQRYQTYRTFAEKYGYPDAVAKSVLTDDRKRPQEGDVVTLLVSGRHESADTTLWIVEAINGERHIYNEKGLHILSESIENVTVLKDESLGGIQREYREVKRKARVGELVKITGKSGHEPFNIGDILAVTVRGSNYACFDEYEIGARDYEEYVVLEPSEIIRIDSERLRMVDRKAAVGERVVVTELVDGKGSCGGKFFRVGNIAICLGGISFDFSGNDYVHKDGNWAMGHACCRVLVPVEGAATDAPLSAQPPLDQAAATIGALAAQVMAMEKRVAALETKKVRSGPVDDMPPSFANITRVKTAQEIRDEIVERAKADVKVLLDRNYWSGYNPTIWFTDKDGSSITDKCDFIVNRDKRTVVALISEIGNGKSFRKGIAKCAPNDVFNAHIGRAISLRRALGLEVPAEYLSVPNPEEPRVGDVVNSNSSLGVVTLVDKARGGIYNTQVKTLEIGTFRILGGTRIIDDSREEVAA